jgi:hypothetical protein
MSKSDTFRLCHRFFVLGVLALTLSILAFSDFTENAKACLPCSECAGTFADCATYTPCNGDSACLQDCRTQENACWHMCCNKVYVVDWNSDAWVMGSPCPTNQHICQFVDGSGAPVSYEFCSISPCIVWGPPYTP